MSTPVTTEQVGPRERWTPGAGLARLREIWGDDRIPQATPEVKARVDALIEHGRQMMSRRGTA